MATIICPRCFLDVPVAENTRFCPRCGLPDVVQAAEDTQPLQLSVDGQNFRVFERIAVGSFCNLYRCEFAEGTKPRQGVLKIARDPRCNWAVDREASILRRLAMKDDGKFAPFFQRVIRTFANGSSQDEVPRQANVLAYHHEIASPHELYTLDDIKAAYPDGLDARDVAWIWRRLLNVLSFVHATGVVHAAVLPAAVQIEIVGHKLVLTDWCFASSTPTSPRPADAAVGAVRTWFDRNGMRRGITPALDIALSARCMVYLLGGDPTRAEFLSTTDPAICRHFERCIDMPDDRLVPAGQLLAEFDQLIEALWGPRQFRPLAMPAKNGEDTRRII